jgi:hypothetical protein
MTDRLPSADLPNMAAALRADRAEMLNFTSGLTDDEWTAPSAAAGWRIADVVAHIGATARSFYIPTGLRTTFTASLEQANEDPVDRRRNWSRAKVMAEYQVAQAPVAGLDARVALTLTGPGGGTWWFDEAGGLAPSDGAVAAHVTAPALTFPDWGTRRSSWRDSDVTVTGDTELAARFLDTVI